MIGALLFSAHKSNLGRSPKSCLKRDMHGATATLEQKKTYRSDELLLQVNLIVSMSKLSE